MDLDPVRAAYAAILDRYIALAEDGPDAPDRAFIHRHLAGVLGRVLDLGCGPGRWTADLHAQGVDVVGVDVVPEFLEHARVTYPGPEFRLGSYTDLDVPDLSLAGVLSWYSTIHVPPAELGDVLAGFRRLLARPASSSSASSTATTTSRPSTTPSSPHTAGRPTSWRICWWGRGSRWSSRSSRTRRSRNGCTSRSRRGRSETRSVYPNRSRTTVASASRDGCPQPMHNG